MMGFLRPYFPGLEKEEKDLYNTYFCSMCYALTEKYGLMGSLVNSYEGVFALILISALRGREEEMLEIRCPIMPLAKRKIYKSDRQLTLIISLFTVIFIEKLKDDMEDDKSIIAGILFRFFKDNYVKAKDSLKMLDFPVEKLEERKKEQKEVEKLSSISINYSSEPFAKTVSELFHYMAEPYGKKQLSMTGYQLGKIIYLYDAYKDFSKDRSQKRFNALMSGYPELRDRGRFTGGVMSDLRKTLTISAFNIRNSIRNLPSGKEKRLVENILFESIMKRIEKIQEA